MTQHCMKSYTQLLIKTCHRRGVHAMGGMAAHIPIRDDPVANQVLPSCRPCLPRFYVALHYPVFLAS